MFTRPIHLGLTTFFLLLGASKLTSTGGPDAQVFPRLGLSLALLKPLGFAQLVIGALLLGGLNHSHLVRLGAPAASAYLGWTVLVNLRAREPYSLDLARVSALLMASMWLTARTR